MLEGPVSTKNKIKILYHYLNQFRTQSYWLFLKSLPTPSYTFAFKRRPGFPKASHPSSPSRGETEKGWGWGGRWVQPASPRSQHKPSSAIPRSFKGQARAGQAGKTPQPG